MNIFHRSKASDRENKKCKRKNERTMHWLSAFDIVHNISSCKWRAHTHISKTPINWIVSAKASGKLINAWEIVFGSIWPFAKFLFISTRFGFLLTGNMDFNGTICLMWLLFHILWICFVNNQSNYKISRYDNLKSRLKISFCWIGLRISFRWDFFRFFLFCDTFNIRIYSEPTIRVRNILYLFKAFKEKKNHIYAKYHMAANRQQF